MTGDDESRVVRTVCQECGNGCGMLVHVEGGRAVRVEAAPRLPRRFGAILRQSRRWA